MHKTKLILSILLTACIMLSSAGFLRSGGPLVAYAEADDTSAEDTLSEAEDAEEGEVLISSDQRTESLSELAEQIMKDYQTVTQLNEMIKSLQETPEEDITKSSILMLHDMYVSLPQAMQARVENYEIVEYHIERLKMEFRDNSKDSMRDVDTGKKLDKIYVFRVDNDSMSISVSYITDKDGDGIPDRPEITLISPSGGYLVLEYLTTTVQNAEIKMSIDWQDDFVQLDIENASNGVWNLKTSDLAVFNLFEYAKRGSQDILPEPSDQSSESEDAPFETETQPEENVKQESLFFAMFKLFLPVILILLSIPVILILIKKFGPGSKEERQSGKPKKKTSKKRRMDDDDDDDDDDDWERIEKRNREKEQAELEAMERYLQSQKVRAESDYDEEAADTDDASIRRQMLQNDDDDDDDPGLIEYTEYPSGMVGKDEAEDDDDFGTRV